MLEPGSRVLSTSKNAARPVRSRASGPRVVVVMVMGSGPPPGPAGTRAPCAAPPPLRPPPGGAAPAPPRALPRPRPQLDPRLDPRRPRHRPGQLEDGDLLRVPQVHRPHQLAPQQTPDPLAQDVHH